MSAPNIMAMSSIYGKTDFLEVTASEQSIVSNAAASGVCKKLNSMYISNKSTTDTISCSIKIWESATPTGTSHVLAPINVPPNSTVVVIKKDAPIYLEEGRCISAIAGVTSNLTVTLSYDLIG